MPVLSRTASGKPLGHEAGRDGTLRGLLGWSHLAVVVGREQTILTLVACDNVDAAIFQEGLNPWVLPAAGIARMFV